MGPLGSKLSWAHPGDTMSFPPFLCVLVQVSLSFHVCVYIASYSLTLSGVTLGMNH